MIAINNPAIESSWIDELEPITPEKYLPIPFLIKAMVDQYPDNIAVVEMASTYSYQTLWQYAERLHQQLLQIKVGVNSHVAILGLTSFQFIASLIAVWMARGVAIPLDPWTPTDRLSNILMDSKAEYAILTDSAPKPEFAFTHVIEITRVDIPLYVKQKHLSNMISTQSEDSAYIFATSGTTGHPKLILGNHNGLSHFLCWQKKQFNITPNDRCLVTTNVTFDVVLRDIFLALISGAMLCINRQANEQLFQLINTHKITYLHATPSKLQAWSLTAPTKTILSSLKWIFSAGEPLTSACVNGWYHLGFTGAFVNLYGPTETTLAKCFYIINQHQKENILPVGQPIPGTEIYLVNEKNQRCVAGEVGEIVIKTPYCTYGYLKGTQETERRFMNVCSSVDRLYFTGDLGWFDKNNQLVVLGRNDEQIKIHGVRIELQEIEFRLNQYPGITQAKILTVGKDPLNKQLVAFYCSTTATPIDSLALTNHLSQYLTVVMLPKYFIQVSDIPLNKNGKVDKNILLTELEIDLKSRATPIVHDQVTQVLLELAQHVLNASIQADTLLINSVFDSLQIMVFLYQINEHFSLNLTIIDIIANPTIAQLAHLVKTPIEKQSRVYLGFNSAATKGAIFAFPPISGWGVIYKSLAETLKDYRFYAFEFLETDNRIECYLEHILNLQRHGDPCYLLGYSAGGNLAFEVAKKLEETNIQLDHLILLDTAPRKIPICASDDELNQFTDDFFKFLVQIGFVHEIIENPSIEAVEPMIKSKLLNYRKYLNALVNVGCIQTNITVIKSEDSEQISKNDMLIWQQLTNKAAASKSGSGDHFSMLEPGHVRANALVIEKILASQSEGIVDERCL